MPASPPKASSKPADAGADAAKPKKTSAARSASSQFLYDAVFLGIAGYLAFKLALVAYRIRLGAINEFGLVIHEFDPYFNFRATEVRGAADGCSLLRVLSAGK